MQATLNYEEYRDKVRGCWLGKNIGGTLGCPMEGRSETNQVDFYVHKLDGAPLPNDDLDLQLLWLVAAERHGIYHLTPQILGEYWISNIPAPWNEYNVCCFNIANGFYPPLSGSCNNDAWKASNGAWIRSEIWACIFPGNPDEAIRFAYMDDCADHTGDGIYAEMFTAALESAAFVVGDLRKLIEIGLSKIPGDCRIARSVKLVCQAYDRGDDWLAAREAVVADSADLGWFQAPGNVAFAVIGLLYGEGDFGKSVCRAVNCGDDTDCTAATVGAILGIIDGAKGIPERWIEPIGTGIKNIALNIFGWPQALELPADIDELSERTMLQAESARLQNPRLVGFSAGPTQVDDAWLQNLTDPKTAQAIWAFPPYEQRYVLPFGEIAIDYRDGVEIASGAPKRITVKIGPTTVATTEVSCRWLLPEGWTAAPPDARKMIIFHRESALEFTLVPGEIPDAVVYIPLEIRLRGRNNPTVLQVPFQRAGSISYAGHAEKMPIQWQLIRLYDRRRARAFTTNN